MKKLLIGMAFCALCMGAQATDYWLKSGTADWSVASSFAIGSAEGPTANNPPGSGDDVYLPAGDVTLASGTDSFASANGVKRIVPQADTRVVITVTETDSPARLLPPVNAGQDATYKRALGTIEKRGVGSLELATDGSYAYFVNLTVVEGTLTLPRGGTQVHYFYGDLSVSNNAVLGLALTAAGGAYTRFRSINGGMGATIQGSDTIVANLLLEHVGSVWYGSARPDSVFGGQIVGYQVYVVSSGDLKLTGTQSTYGQTTTVQFGDNAFGTGSGGCIEVASLGRIGSATSLGKGMWISMGNGGGGYRYLGAGESADRWLNVNDTGAGNGVFFDAGANGGLTFEGEWRNSNPRVTEFRLMGSNETACVLQGKISQTGGYPFYFKKTGTGVWRFADSDTRDFRGGLAVEDGRLQFTTIANAGVQCSLGYATYLTRCMTDVPTQADMRPYAYVIGSTNEDEHAIFEYVGSDHGVATNRPVAVLGEGAICSLATGKGWLGLADVSSLDDAATLVLDGTNENNNVLLDVRDGDNGPLTIVKRGPGEWKLSGNQMSTGGLRVEEGVLTVAGPRYTWFRLSLKECGKKEDSTVKGQVVMRQIALYDANGVRQNTNLRYDTQWVSGGNHPADCDWLSLTPGSVALGRAGWRAISQGQDVDQLFTDSEGSLFSNQYLVSATGDAGEGYVIMDKDDPSTWTSFVMRLTNGVPEIAAYDIRSYYNNSIDCRWPKYIRMEGSADGIRWDVLSDDVVNSSLCGAYGDRWLSDGSAFASDQIRQGAGFPIRGAATGISTFADLGKVSVAAGARLQLLSGDVRLKDVEVDTADCGTISGFALAPKGKLTVKNASGSGTITLPDFLVHAKDVENLADWKLNLNGKDRPNYEIRVSEDGRVTLVPPGLAIIVR